jgi:hypothetical protein
MAMLPSRAGAAWDEIDSGVIGEFPLKLVNGMATTGLVAAKPITAADPKKAMSLSIVLPMSSMHWSSKAYKAQGNIQLGKVRKLSIPQAREHFRRSRACQGEDNG